TIFPQTSFKVLCSLRSPSGIFPFENVFVCLYFLTVSGNDFIAKLHLLTVKLVEPRFIHNCGNKAECPKSKYKVSYHSQPFQILNNIGLHDLFASSEPKTVLECGPKLYQSDRKKA